MNRQEIIEAIARTVYETNLSYSHALGDTSHSTWEAAPVAQRAGVIRGVEGAISGYGPEKVHATWIEAKKAEGWKYGAVRDPSKLESPSLVPYEDLPEAQKFKNTLLITIVKGIAAHYGVQADVLLPSQDAHHPLEPTQPEFPAVPHADHTETEPVQIS